MSTRTTKLATTILNYLNQAGRIGELGELVASLTQSKAYKMSQHQVILTTPSPLDATALHHVEAFVAKQVGPSYHMRSVVDPTLLAGFTLQIDDNFTDASALGKITRLQQTFSQGDLS